MAWCLWWQPAKAAVKPSFDCNKAQTEAEKLVCSDDDLAKLDNELAKRYTKIKRYQAFVLDGVIRRQEKYGKGG